MALSISLESWGRSYGSSRKKEAFCIYLEVFLLKKTSGRGAGESGKG